MFLDNEYANQLLTLTSARDIMIFQCNNTHDDRILNECISLPRDPHFINIIAQIDLNIPQNQKSFEILKKIYPYYYCDMLFTASEINYNNKQTYFDFSDFEIITIEENLFIIRGRLSNKRYHRYVVKRD